MSQLFTKEQKKSALKVFDKLMSIGVSEFSYKIINPNIGIPELYDDERIIEITTSYNIKGLSDDIYTIGREGLILCNGSTSKLNF